VLVPSPSCPHSPWKLLITCSQNALLLCVCP